MNLLPMSAIIKGTEPPLYKTPYEAEKGIAYVCPDCKKDLILKKGEILRHHFAHKSSVTPCTYYDRPTESQMHKEAKHLIASRINNGDPLTIRRKCKNKGCDFEELHQITNAKAVEEYGFVHNNSHKKADIGIVVDDQLNHVIEIYHTHKTCEEDRPEPWCEVDARITVEGLQDNASAKEFSIKCIRNIYECNSCISQREMKEAIERERKEKEEEQKRVWETAQKEKIEKELERERLRESAEKERREKEAAKREKEAEEKRTKKAVDKEIYDRGWVKYYDKEYNGGFMTEAERKKKKYLIIYHEECKDMLYNLRKTKKKCASCKLTYWCKKCNKKYKDICDKEIEKLISEWQEIMSE
jgi:Competence protein CoiA-like family